MSAGGKSSNRMYDERRWGYEQKRTPIYRRPIQPVVKKNWLQRLIERYKQ